MTDSPKLPGGFVTAYIGLGSNLGDRSKNLSGAVERLSRIGTAGAISVIYETKPWGVDGYQPRYLNQVVAVSTTLDPLEVVTELLGIEHSLGRSRQEKNWTWTCCCMAPPSSTPVAFRSRTRGSTRGRLCWFRWPR